MKIKVTKAEAQNNANEMLFQILMNVRKNHPDLYRQLIKVTDWDTTDLHLLTCLSVLYNTSEEDRLAINAQIQEEEDEEFAD